MKATPPVAVELAAAVARAARRPGAARTLLIDLDGTLARLAVDPASVRVPPEVLEVLQSLARGGWRVVIASGRPLAEVRRLAPSRAIRAFGSHGLEPPSRSRGGSSDRALARSFDRLERGLRRLAGRWPGARIERKPFGLAVHDREVAPRELRAWRALLRRWLDAQDLRGLERLRGRRVLELRPAGASKAAILPRLRLPGPDGRRDASLVAIGDDQTDEDLFRALVGRGLCVRVGARRERSAASRRLPSPAAVARFLSALATLETVAHAGHPRPATTRRRPRGR